MYTMDNDGYFNPGTTKWADQYWARWGNVLHKYAGDDFKDFWCCPMANTPQNVWPEGNEEQTSARQPWRAWGKFNPTSKNMWFYQVPGVFGSYGLNAWVVNPPVEMESRTPPAFKRDGRYPLKDFWRHTAVRGTAKIPMFADCKEPRAWPDDTDTSSPDPEGTADCDHHMRTFQIDRHEGSGYINGAFLDFSVRKIGLKELWKLKWHRSFDINGGPTPDDFDRDSPWLRKYKDYERKRLP